MREKGIETGTAEIGREIEVEAGIGRGIGTLETPRREGGMVWAEIGAQSGGTYETEVHQTDAEAGRRRLPFKEGNRSTVVNIFILYFFVTIIQIQII